jgi:hypothetical protein
MKIPPALHSARTGRPFASCSICEQAINFGTHHFIEKVYRRGELFFEYAICIPCVSELRAGYSEQSLALIEEFYEARVDFEARRKALLSQASDRYEPWVAECLVSRRPISWDADYSVVAAGLMGQLLLGLLPYAVLLNSIEDLVLGLSRQTRDAYDRFVREELGIPPERSREPSTPMILV